MGEIAIEVTDLHKTYGSNEAVRGIDLEVQAGEVFGFLGTNGAGKTTTIEILEGYRDRTQGDVAVLGVDPSKPTQAWRNRIGMVLQECELDPLMTVKEIVTMFSGFYERPRNVEETVELVGLKEKRGARVGTLSGGQRRRVDVAVGLIGDPDLLFLDEPTTGFDPSARHDAWNMIEGLKALGKTIFLTTHYMDEAQHLADRVAILRAGKIVASGKLDDLHKQIGSTTSVRFKLPSGVSQQDLESAMEGAAAKISGDEVTFEIGDAQRQLYKLLTWADTKNVSLENLRVERPSLEDVFLELTSEPTQGGE